MQHYGIKTHVDHILKKYPELTTFKCERRIILRRDTEKMKKHKRIRKLPNLMKMKRQVKSGLFTEDNISVKLFICPICRNVLKEPITVDCGHTFCNDCLNRNNTANCLICAIDIRQNSAVNVLVKNLVEKWRVRNKNSSEVILGVQPRYYLRSGFVGREIIQQQQPLQQFQEDENLFTVSDLECILCSRCILDPTTTSCGHTFCRDCFTRVLDHGLSCPLCMASLSVKDYSRGTSVVLDQAIRCLLPTEYNKRLLANVKEIQMMNKNADIPVFICTNAFPGVACPLYVYEPRYRLLVRRCLLSTTRRFAMAAKEGTGEKFVSFGTLLEVKDAVYLEDGSFILTTLGVRRFKVVGRGEQDGYDTAKIQIIKDTAVSSDKLPELLNLHQKVYDKASKWISSLTGKVLAEVERLIGQMPQVEENWPSLPDGPSWAWWLMPILPLSSQLQVGFLSTTSLEKRLRAIDKMLERMEIRMRALERNTLNCSVSEDASESCSDSERSFDIPFNAN